MAKLLGYIDPGDESVVLREYYYLRFMEGVNPLASIVNCWRTNFEWLLYKADLRDKFNPDNW